MLSLQAAEEGRQRARRLRYQDAIAPSPPPAQPEGPEEGPECKAPPEYAIVANDFRCPGDPKDFPGQRVAIRASLKPPLPSPVEVGRSWWVKEEQAYRARRGGDGLGCSRCGYLSPPRAPLEPLRMQPPPPPCRSEPRPASDDDGSSDDNDGDYEYLYYRPRYE
jgi:hypothetical protein